MISYHCSYCPKCMRRSGNYHCTCCGTKTIEAMEKMPHCKSCGCQVADDIMNLGTKFDFCPACGLPTADAIIGPLPKRRPIRSFLSRIFHRQ